MTFIHATLTFALPEDHDSDQLIITESSSQNGPFGNERIFDYRYGTTKLEIELDDQRWYRLQFNNSKENKAGPPSDPVYGGGFADAAPFLAVSTTTDGANYANTQDLYDYSGLSPQDITVSRVSAALRRARAIIDWRTAEMGILRLEVHETEMARRKYNARLRVLKEAEINIALGHVYQNIADDVIIEHRRLGDESLTGGTAIGGTAVGGENLAERSDSIAFMAALSDRYFRTGEELLASIDASSIRLIASEYGRRRYPRFLWPLY